MQNNSFVKNIFKSASTIFSFATLGVLVSCGDGGVLTPAVSCGTSCASNVQLLVSSQQVLTSSIGSVDLTAVVLDASGQAMTEKVVTFGRGTDASAYFTGVSAITDSNGLAVAKLNLGTDKSNRTITVTATADGATGTNTVTATGTKISISGNTTLSTGTTTSLTIIVKDSAGVALPGVDVSITSTNGNPISLSPATGVTDSNGQIIADVTATNAGSGADTLTVTGAGATQIQALTISSENFAFTAPVAPFEIVVGPSTNVSVTWTNANGPVPNKVVNFFTSRGLIGQSATTNASGVATVSASATSTGTTILTAKDALTGTPAATLTVVYITTSATDIVAQANPGTIGVNSSTSTTNQSVISVVVRDATGNLVKNAEVVFSANPDPSQGNLTSGTATTDITGTASVNYVAGPSYSCANCVKINATVSKVNGEAIAPISSTASLTVAQQSLYVRLATDNKIYPDTPIAGTFTKQYTALVTDAAGNPAPDGTKVSFAIRPALSPLWSYAKGWYTWNAVTTNWDQTVSVSCVSEDANRNNTLEGSEDINLNGILDAGEDINLNGVLDTGEDINGNGNLDPLGVATVNPTATTTGGFAIAKIAYAADYATWVQQELEARAGVSGNDPPNVITIFLPGLATDYTSESPGPPGKKSPFGISAVCTDTL